MSRTPEFSAPSDGGLESQKANSSQIPNPLTGYRWYPLSSIAAKLQSEAKRRNPRINASQDKSSTTLFSDRALLAKARYEMWG